MTLKDRPSCPHLRRAAEEVEGLSFRGLRGPSDAEIMSRVSHLSWKDDGVEWLVSPEDIRSRLEDKSDHDPISDLVFAEIGGDTVGYAEVTWDSSDSDPKYYKHAAHLLPQWRGKGIREAMFRSNEERILEVSSLDRSPSRKYIQVWTFDGPNEWKDLVESWGYPPSWHLLEMVYTDMRLIKDAPTPTGLDLGPARPEDYAGIWALFRECFSREPWSSPDAWGEAEFEEWKASKDFMPALWKIARSGGEVVGVVENYVNEDEHATYGKRVAHSHRVCVKDGWRRKGLATYLLTSSLKLLRDMGVDEVTLDTEVENKSRAMRVYEGVGFSTRRTFTFYAKPV